jgi:hypothetical protein
MCKQHQCDSSTHNVFRYAEFSVLICRECGKSSLIERQPMVKRSAWSRRDRAIVMMVSVYAALAACFITAVLVVPSSPTIGAAVVLGLVVASLIVLRRVAMRVGVML